MRTAPTAAERGSKRRVASFAHVIVHRRGQAADAKGEAVVNVVDGVEDKLNVGILMAWRELKSNASRPKQSHKRILL